MKRKLHQQHNYSGSSAVILLIGIALGTLYSCKKTNTLSQGNEAALNTDVEMHEVASLSAPVSLLTDQTFQQGLSVLHPTGGAIQDTLQYPGAASSPQWKLAQWYSRIISLRWNRAGCMNCLKRVCPIWPSRAPAGV